MSLNPRFSSYMTDNCEKKKFHYQIQTSSPRAALFRLVMDYLISTLCLHLFMVPNYVLCLSDLHYILGL